MSANLSNHALRHYLAALWYRTCKAVNDAPDGFATFSPGHGVRTPAAILGHIADLVAFIVAMLTDTEPDQRPAVSLDDELYRLRQHLVRTDMLLHEPELSRRAAERILQGPLADAMTHAGQLALLRRLAGSPIPPEDFSSAALEPGNFPLMERPSE